MAQRAVGRLFRGQNAGPPRQSVGPLTQRRYASRHSIPSFPQTSSPDLDFALNRFREELFIPWGLTEPQRKLVFCSKYKSRLEEAPVTVSIGKKEDETYRLRPMKWETRPTKRDAIDAIKLMKTRKDWDNLVPFMTGLRMARWPIQHQKWEQVIRWANQADALGAIVECAKRAGETGLRLNDIGVVQGLFFELHRKAHRGQFQDPDVSKALRMANQAVTLLESEEHVQQNPLLDPKRRPLVTGVMLELTAARALNVLGGNDEGNFVRTYAQRLLGVLPEDNFKAQDNLKWPEYDELLQEIVPIYNGMRLATQIGSVVKDKAISPNLRSRTDFLSKSIAFIMDKADQTVKEKPTLGLAEAQLLVKV